MSRLSMILLWVATFAIVAAGVTQWKYEQNKARQSARIIALEQQLRDSQTQVTDAQSRSQTSQNALTQANQRIARLITRECPNGFPLTIDGQLERMAAESFAREDDFTGIVTSEMGMFVSDFLQYLATAGDVLRLAKAAQARGNGWQSGAPGLYEHARIATITSRGGVTMATAQPTPTATDVRLAVVGKFLTRFRAGDEVEILGYQLTIQGVPTIAAMAMLKPGTLAELRRKHPALAAP